MSTKWASRAFASLELLLSLSKHVRCRFISNCSFLVDSSCVKGKRGPHKQIYEIQKDLIKLFHEPFIFEILPPVATSIDVAASTPSIGLYCDFEIPNISR